jgi:hypothetical protein
VSRSRSCRYVYCPSRCVTDRYPTLKAPQPPAQ